MCKLNAKIHKKNLCLLYKNQIFLYFLFVLFVDKFNEQLFILFIDNFGLARSETSTRCRPDNGPLRLANIWSRLLKHNWWDPLYERVRTHSDVFFDLTFNENSFLYDYINRASPEFQPMHVYSQQLCPLFHRCESPPLFLNSWR